MFQCCWKDPSISLNWKKSVRKENNRAQSIENMWVAAGEYIFFLLNSLELRRPPCQGGFPSHSSFQSI